MYHLQQVDEESFARAHGGEVFSWRRDDHSEALQLYLTVQDPFNGFTIDLQRSNLSPLLRYFETLYKLDQ